MSMLGHFMNIFSMGQGGSALKQFTYLKYVEIDHKFIQFHLGLIFGLLNNIFEGLKMLEQAFGSWTCWAKLFIDLEWAGGVVVHW